ncbi:MAG: phage tail protein, partial [Thaumarchaeota archaeon]|nr:phage tail protein [Nitrososphaerota archaeon]
MPKSPAKPTRANPYKNFKFQLRSGDKTVAGISKVSPFYRTGKVSHRGGADPSNSHKGSGRTKWDAITLERGVTYDPDFDQWAAQVSSSGTTSGSEASLANLRRDLSLDFMNEAGQKIRSYKIYRCWVSEYKALPDLDANANAIAI